MGRISVILPNFLLLFILSPILTDASDVSLERSLQYNLEKSRGIIKKAQERLKAGYPVTAEINELKGLYEEIRASHLLVEDRFRLREEEVKVHGAKALERHRVMSDNYSRALRDYLSLIEGLSSTLRNPQSALRNLESLVDQTLARKKRRIFGSLPYRHLKYPTRGPNESPPIKPAYRGGNRATTPDDLKSTLEAPISMEIGTLAQFPYLESSLNL